MHTDLQTHTYLQYITKIDLNRLFIVLPIHKHIHIQTYTHTYIHIPTYIHIYIYLLTPHILQSMIKNK